MDTDDLKAMGITKTGHRRKLLRNAVKLRSVNNIEERGQTSELDKRIDHLENIVEKVLRMVKKQRQDVIALTEMLNRIQKSQK